MVFTCLGVFLVALLFEMMKTWRDRLQSRQLRRNKKNSDIMSDVPKEHGNGKAFNISTSPSHERYYARYLLHEAKGLNF